MDQEKENKEGIDLSGEHKDSDKGIKFQNEEWQRPTQTFFPGTPKIIQWVIKYSGGLVKNKNQAVYVLLGLVGLFLVIAIIIFSNDFGGPSEPPAGYKGNIPDLPEYRHPPTPQDFR